MYRQAPVAEKSSFHTQLAEESHRHKDLQSVELTGDGGHPDLAREQGEQPSSLFWPIMEENLPLGYTHEGDGITDIFLYSKAFKGK